MKFELDPFILFYGDCPWTFVRSKFQLYVFKMRKGIFNNVNSLDEVSRSFTYDTGVIYDFWNVIVI